MFYADTTVGGVARTIRTSIEFFGIDHVMRQRFARLSN
jgi:hypothetical protein